jgi:hypothetical protein
MPERQCNGCKRRVEWGCEAERHFSSKDNKAAQPDKNGNWWVWSKPANLPMVVDGEESYACPRQDLMRHPMEWHRMLLFYGLYKKGHLPERGSVLDQSNRAVEIFRILDDVNFECDQAVEEERRAKANREPRQKGRRR